MHFAVAAVLAAATPSPSSTLDPDLVTPGPWGFGVIAFVAIAVMLLVWDMLRRIRRARYRFEIGEDLDAEEAAARAKADADGATRQDPSAPEDDPSKPRDS
ncbi:ribose/xylose/arabinose/galactoside ABC-type transport system permease subunit [Microbacterium endophyticum]|uniref:Ribose/xylose/arabinose/galactoside ABC-type transport system permease subunit n=1 Tax=Microbacterium endophyticum TaxID=1526412 RepID=A0A7W4V0Z6_9MICO|nr:hypothetical protein [Microbacterium endophyticum]MBB2974851.1 ribose/xylose/arabinose/galactoside ABC-type transport system permease subunit [Microbacterium endophyticum]NIK37148.1 ribose/xylose/arabinose/galactoside ABC-type transport system permease subunit [Microbacterium endophyticum]